MILTCPNCNSQFKVSIEALGNKGRSVRCSACGETWFEDSHLKELDENIDEDNSDIFEVDFDDVEEQAEEQVFEEIEIPDAIKPQGESGSVANNHIPNNKSNVERKTAYAISAVTFIIILIYLLLFSTSIMRSNPAMQAFYGLFGISMEIPTSDKVTFANLQANEHEGVIKVSGDIINLTEDMQTLRMLEISLNEDSDEEKIKWFATPPKIILEAEESVKFSSEYKLDKSQKSNHAEGSKANGHDAVNIDDHASGSASKQFIRVRFVLKPALPMGVMAEPKKGDGGDKHKTKTDAKDGGNSQAHHESGSGH